MDLENINPILWKKVCPATAQIYPKPEDIQEAETSIKQEDYLESYKEGLIQLILKKEKLDPMNLEEGEGEKFHQRQKELKNYHLEKIQEIAEEKTIKTNKEAETQTNKLYEKQKNVLKAEIPQLIALKERSTATEKITQLIEFGHVMKTTRSDKNPEMWVYKNGIYITEGETIIKAETRDILGKLHTTTFTNEIIAKIQADTYIDQEELFNQQNKHPYLLPVKNGILNIKTKELEPFTPNIYFFNKINAEYKPTSKCPHFIKFLKEIVERPETDIKIIQELFGYSLIRSYKYEKAFMLYGANGRNGKSKLLNVLTTFLGVENTAEVSLQKMEQERFCLAELHNKLVNISGDISNEAINNTGTFKSLTGGDTIMVDRKFKNQLKLNNYAKMIFASNELPPIRSQSDAFWLRWVIINFPNQFLPIKELQDNPKAKLQDTELISKLTTTEELNGILNWAIEGLNSLENKKDFSTNKTSQEIKTEWLRKSNSVNAFIIDHIEEDYNSQVEKSEFKKRYLSYCRSHKIKPVSDKVIKITIENETGATTKRERPYFQGEKKDDIYYWEGIKFNNKEVVTHIAQDAQLASEFSPLGKNLIFAIGSKTNGKLGKLGNLDKNSNLFINEESIISEKSILYHLQNLGKPQSFDEIAEYVDDIELTKTLINKLLLTGDLVEVRPKIYQTASLPSDKRVNY